MTQPVVHLPLIDRYLEQQRELTVIERFAQRHAADELPVNAESYRELIPLTRPTAGEQYAFSVNLDACTGCKACVTACHRLNGLDADETWRSVGMLHGGTASEPVVRTVTTACHHCVEPACMSGCPVSAYEKDADTGIVRHLDDQCIGCQYCVFTCPYEVPRFNSSRGIVRKCDMCSDRLAAGEAPACVQACPNRAIAIEVVSKDTLRREARQGSFLASAPSPAITTPSTRYRSAGVMPSNLVPGDLYQSRPSHEHWPLVIMLVLTQLSVGAYVTELALASARAIDVPTTRPYHALVALLVGLAALGASTLHLGRPRYAFRALVGIRTSWMSREILAFGVFAGLAATYAASLWTAFLPGLSARLPATLVGQLQQGLSWGVAAAGVGAVLCSVMLYHVTRRAWWSVGRTSFRFFGTTALLGLASTLTVSILVPGAFDSAHATSEATRRLLALLVIGVTSVKLAGELAVLSHRSPGAAPDLRRTATLLTGALGDVTRRRILLALVGGVALPGLMLLAGTEGATAAVRAAAVLSLATLVGGEILERRLFFSAVSPPRMPGRVGG